MKFDEWVLSLGYDPDGLPDQQRVKLERIYAELRPQAASHGVEAAADAGRVINMPGGAVRWVGGPGLPGVIQAVPPRCRIET